MKDKTPVPTAVQVVAGLFLLSGICSAVGMVLQWREGSIFIDQGILGFAAFFGLLRLSAGWRTFALFCIWLGFMTCPVMLAFALFAPRATIVRVFNIPITDLPHTWLAMACMPVFLLLLWAYRVLTRPAVRALFYPLGSQPTN